MDFTIVTPSFRQLDWLACCIASIADQDGVTIEHIVQDAGTAGFTDFAEKMKKIWPDRQGYRRVMASEPDQGMYDAVNKGLKKGTGTFCAYLNCDEQYLPGALARVKREFEKKPAKEILYGGFLVVDEKGKLVTAQRPVNMFWQHVATSHLPNFTCATFFRRAMLERDQAWFDSSYRACGDAAWTLARLKQRTPFLVLNYFLSTFMEGTGNQGLSQTGLTEAEKIREAAPIWVKAGAPLWKLCHRIRKLATGRYACRPICYSLFLRGEKNLRTECCEPEPSPVWRTRWSPKISRAS